MKLLPYIAATTGLLLSVGAFCTGSMAQSAPPDPIGDVGMVNVVNYGAVGDSHTNCDQAFSAAILVSIKTHAPLEVPVGTYVLTAPINLDGIDLVGAGAGSVLWFPQSLGAGISAITVSNGWNGNIASVIRDVRICGPGTWQLGVKNAGFNGVTYTGNAFGEMERVRIQGFDSGLVFNNTCGHIHVHNSRFGNNYYGLYIQHNSSDYSVDSSELDGNNFASIGMAANSGPDDFSLTDVHLGYSPYGIYQEPGPTKQGNSAFLMDAVLMHCRFECIGNAAIESDAGFMPGNTSTFKNVSLTHVGFSWCSKFQIPSRRHTYAVYVPFAEGFNQINSGADPFTSSEGRESPAYYFGVQNSLLEIDQQGFLSNQVLCASGHLPIVRN